MSGHPVIVRVELGSAVSADPLPLELRHLMVVPAERARVGHLAQDDVSPFDRYVEVVALPDVEHPPGLGRYHDSSQIVDLAGYPRVHAGEPTDWGRMRAGYRRLP